MGNHSHQHHNHGHHHEPHDFNQAFQIAIVANALFVVLQIITAFWANSNGLLADAIHNMGDVLSLILAWMGNRLLKKEPTIHTTYGMKKTSILASLANGLLLVFTSGIIATEALYKLLYPSEIETTLVMIVATLGIVVNATTAALFFKGSSDLNIRGAFLHLFYDAIISFGVVISAYLIYLSHWIWLDPVVGLIIAAIILRGTWSLFKDSFRLIIDAVPRGISFTEVHQLLKSENGVEQVHDLHIWALSTKENAMSVHLWMPNAELSDEARQQIVKRLKEIHNIHHSTIQIEKNLAFCDDACKKLR